MRFSHNPFYKKTDYELKATVSLYYFNKKVGRYTAVGQIFPLFSFSHLLVIVYFFFALRYFVNYATLLFISFCGGL